MRIYIQNSEKHTRKYIIHIYCLAVRNLAKTHVNIKYKYFCLAVRNLAKVYHQLFLILFAFLNFCSSNSRWGKCSYIS